MVHSFAVNPGSIGVFVAMAASRKPFTWCNIQAQNITAGETIRVTGPEKTGGVVLAPGSGANPGASITMPATGGIPLPNDFTQLFIKITHAGDGVDVIYGQ